MVNGTLDVSSTLQDRRNTRQYGVDRSARAKLPRPHSGPSKPEKPWEWVRTLSRKIWGNRRARSRQDLPLSASPWGALLFLASCDPGFRRVSLRCGGWDVGAGGLGEALRVIPLPPQTPWCNENPQNLTVREKLYIMANTSCATTTGSTVPFS